VADRQSGGGNEPRALGHAYASLPLRLHCLHRAAAARVAINVAFSRWLRVMPAPAGGVGLSVDAHSSVPAPLHAACRMTASVTAAIDASVANVCWRVTRRIDRAGALRMRTL